MNSETLFYSFLLMANGISVVFLTVAFAIDSTLGIGGVIGLVFNSLLCGRWITKLIQSFSGNSTEAKKQ